MVRNLGRVVNPERKRGVVVQVAVDTLHLFGGRFMIYSLKPQFINICWIELMRYTRQYTYILYCLQVLPNGNLVFPPFRAEDYRQEVHAQVYSCLATSPAGSVHSRDVNVRAGKILIFKALLFQAYN